MTKEVLVTVTGRQFDLEDEPIELMTQGTYYMKNGKHYVLYEEQPDESIPIIKNRVKFHENYFEMTKNGGIKSALTFLKNQRTESLYETGAGAVKMEVDTHELVITETDELLHAVVRYALFMNGQFISECEVNFKVRQRGSETSL